MPSPAPVRALRTVVAWVLGLVLLAGTGCALGVALYPVVTGGQSLAVLSGSMTPGLPVGGMVFTRQVDPAEIGVGDVITFGHPSDPTVRVTHRVIAVDSSTGTPVFTTQGDANEDPDRAPVPASAVQGRLWFAVPEIGRLVAILHSPKGVGVLVVLVCGLLAVHPGKRTDDDAPATEPARSDPGVDADDARTVVMAPVREDGGAPVRDERRAPVRDERLTVMVGAARPSVPVPPPLARLLD
ncbi:signal peptidase I [Trujillonella endophytica]|uniref:Signal peptidase I n=1 Tax=Trujillonella endophytica TaxID=673521 RepID=A0A1H8PI71_9ACTN|nr:signal peptidase I [Trujillella endophytica]SEO41253.1 signal peptidase I [Trujillella endophytica]